MLAVKICEVAVPLEFVVSVSVPAAGDVANVPLAPEEGAVKVTVTPLAGDPLDVTVACNAVAKGWPIAALCELPAVAAMEIVGWGGVVLPLLLLLQPTNTKTRAKVIPKKMDWRSFIAVLPSPLWFFSQRRRRVAGQRILALSGLRLCGHRRSVHAPGSTPYRAVVAALR